MFAAAQVSADTQAPPTSPADAALITRLLESQGIRQASAELDRLAPQINDLMVTLNEIPAPPFGEAARGAAFAEALEQAGIAEVSTDAVGNVLARVPGTVGRRTVALIAHLDTVFPKETDVTVKRDGAVYSAPGIGDNTRGLAMLVALARAITESGWTLDADLLLVGSVGEEGLGDLRGVRHLFGPEGVAIDAVIAIDGGRATRLVTEAVGSNRYRVTFRGAGGHSYGSFGRANPHHALANAIDRFARYAQRVADAPGVKATFSVGRIGGGTSVNSIAFASWMEVDMRSADPARLAALDTAFRRAVDEALAFENDRRTLDRPLVVRVESVGQRPAGQQSLDLPLIRYAIAAQRALGMEPTLVASSTDGNVPIALGIPAITIARGGVSKNAHSLAESWVDQETRTSERVALLLIAAVAGFSE